jgi:hypothetical protein
MPPRRVFGVLDQGREPSGEELTFANRPSVRDSCSSSNRITNTSHEHEDTHGTIVELTKAYPTEQRKVYDDIKRVRAACAPFAVWLRNAELREGAPKPKTCFARGSNPSGGWCS